MSGPERQGGLFPPTPLGGAAVIFWSTDGQGTFTMSEGGGLEALGFAPGEVVGQSIFELFADSRDVVDAHRRALGGEQVHYGVQLDGIRLECVLCPIVDDDGEVKGTVGVAADTTEHLSALEDLRRSEASLARAQRIARLGNWDAAALECTFRPPGLQR